ncbi:hypothetical protein SNE40_021868 [Patella caerulea]|uniref:Tyr recombinase domain-containing protein n=1 Tax=Patella caerulea TaxID=87958 RepID=A0AAN8G0Y4_PATCE
MCKSADMGGHHTNHSLRATTATKLFQQGVDEQLIMARTGHRSVEGVRSYKRISFEQNKVLSNILNGNDASVESSSSRPSTSVDHGGSCTALSETEEMFPNVVFNNCTFNMK